MPDSIVRLRKLRPMRPALDVAAAPPPATIASGAADAATPAPNSVPEVSAAEIARRVWRLMEQDLREHWARHGGQSPW
jgi:hypothetical protein